MTRYLDLELALTVAARAIGAEPVVGDVGLLESALARPRTTVFGQDAYVSLHEKAAALLHSLAKNHPLVDGNKRLAWLATVVFLYVNGVDVDAPEDDAYDFVISIAAEDLDDVGQIADGLRQWSRSRDQERG